jgi:hypothetical protein
LAYICYDINHTSKWTGPLWLVYSVANAKWFAQQSTLAQGSAVFYLKNDERPEDSLLRVLWEIEDHHPKVADTPDTGPRTLNRRIQRTLSWSAGSGV